MEMFRRLSDKLKFPALEEEVLEYWKTHRVFEQTLQRPDAPDFTFYEGPPTANGKPGIHHVFSRTIKDLVCRYKTMRGYQVHRKAGWDTHGLPVEIEVERKLEIKQKEEIEEYGIDRFNAECRKSVFEYKNVWKNLTTRMGYWVDMDSPYITCENDYIESVWWALDSFFKKDLIYQGFKVQLYCPRCGTPLSSHEVSLGYRDVDDPSIYVKARLTDQKDTFFLVWDDDALDPHLQRCSRGGARYRLCSRSGREMNISFWPRNACPSWARMPKSSKPSTGPRWREQNTNGVRFLPG